MEPAKTFPVSVQPVFPVERQLVLIGTEEYLEEAGRALDGKTTALAVKPVPIPSPSELANVPYVHDRMVDCILAHIRGRDAPFWYRFGKVGLALAEMVAGGTPVLRQIYVANAGARLADLIATLDQKFPIRDGSPVANASDIPPGTPTLVYQVDAVVGDQHSISGSPSAGPVANHEDFDAQWALGAEHGIALEEGSRPHSTDVRVAVFDASPFDLGAGQTTACPDLSGIVGVGNSGWLEVWHPFEVMQASSLNSVPFPHHGLCVASLVHKVAPHAQVELHRVLNMFLEGDATLLAEQIIAFANRKASPGSTWQGVINLSLHVNGPIEEGTLCYLAYAICYARAHDILVVAAAGNETPAGQPNGSQPLYPASEPDVIGVAASSLHRNRAWFSNEGNVMAPGCGVAAMVYQHQPGSDGYVWVSGSSYATPLVSGMAALALQKQKNDWNAAAHPANAAMPSLAEPAKDHVLNPVQHVGGVIHIGRAFPHHP